MIPNTAELEEMWQGVLPDNITATDADRETACAYLAREGFMSLEELTPTALAAAEAAGLHYDTVDRLHILGADARRHARAAGRVRAEIAAQQGGPAIRVEAVPGFLRLRFRPDLWHREMVSLPPEEARAVAQQIIDGLREVVAGAGAPKTADWQAVADSEMWAALFTIAPDANGNGGMEMVGAGYARACVTLESGPGGAVRNARIVFPTAEVAWPPAVALGLFAEPTGRDWAVLPPFALQPPMAAEQGGTLEVSAGVIQAMHEA